MSEWVEYSNRCVVSAILPRRASIDVTEFLLGSPGRRLLAINARGTVIKDRWYQSLIPIISPEQELLQFLLPREDADGLMQQIVALGQLRLAGAGAVFSHQLKQFMATSDFPDWQCRDHSEIGLTIRFKRNLVGIAATVQSSISEAVARAAIKAGSHGPTIHYCEGRGVRDRLGVLRFTQNPDKEIIRVIVDEMDAEAVFEAMASAGRLTEPGKGIIYSMPVHNGLIKLPGVTQSSRRPASIQQIIHAIDDLKGCADWRAASNLIETPRSSSGGALSFLGLRSAGSRKYLHNLVRITCSTKRKQVDTLVDSALKAGAPAATTVFGRFVESESMTSGKGIRLNRELGSIQMILPPDQVGGIIDALRQTTDDKQLEAVAIYTTSIDKVLTYLG